MNSELLRTLGKIDSIASRIQTHPEYSACAAREKRIALSEDAKRHSIALEIRAAEKGRPLPVDSLRTAEESMLRNLNSACDYLGRYGADTSSISVLGNIIDPIANPNRHFRRGSEIEFGGFTPPTAAEVPHAVESLAYFLKTTSIHPVLRAAEAHMELVRIHPFSDGNGRAARLLQNHCLMERGFSPAVISSNEKALYHAILHPALEDRYKRETSPEEPGHHDYSFYAFIASKALDSIEELDRELMTHRAYSVSLRGLKQNGAAYKIAQTLRKNAGFRQGTKVHVESTRERKEVRLDVIGNVSHKEITKLVAPVARKFGFRYEIQKVGC